MLIVLNWRGSAALLIWGNYPMIKAIKAHVEGAMAVMSRRIGLVLRTPQGVGPARR